jgi:hypothetical protein
VERIIGKELQRHRWAEADLLVRRKNDPVKLEMAARLRRQGCIKLRIGPRTVPVRSTYEQAGVLERLENPGAVVTAANRDGSRSVELDAALLRRETTLSTKAIALRIHLASSKAANRSLHRYLPAAGVASASQGQLGI